MTQASTPRQGSDKAFDRITFLLRVVTRAEQKTAVDWCKSTGVTEAQARALMILEQEGGSTTASKIVKQSRTTPASVASLLAGMETKGYVVRHASQTDSRSKVVEITDEGKSIVEQWLQATVEAQRKVFGHLTPEQTNDLIDLLEVVAQPLEKHSRGG